MWENYQGCVQLEYKYEESAQVIKSNPEQWARQKCEFEAHAIALLLFWAGGSDREFTDAV